MGRDSLARGDVGVGKRKDGAEGAIPGVGMEIPRMGEEEEK